MKVALVYDRANKIGGAERVLLALHEIYPQAPLFTAVYDPQGAPWAKVFPQVISSFLERFPFAKRHHEAYAYLMPLAFESFNFNDYDLVVSVTSEAAKGIITQPKTRHICYCLSTTRYLWQSYGDYFKNPLWRAITKPVVTYLRNWDKIAAQRPDVFVAISENVAQRIKKYYGRESEVIYPPVDVQEFRIKNKESRTEEGYFLVVSRLVKYKKVGLVIEAFNELGWKLKVVGVGREMGRLRRMAGKNVQFLGHLTDEALLNYYQNCQAVIFPQEEDFGIVPLEAQALGKPVIAYRLGGATETVLEGETGAFFYPQTVEALVKTLNQFRLKKFSEKNCRQQAEKFNQKRFAEEFKNLVEKRWKEHLKNTSTF